MPLATKVHSDGYRIRDDTASIELFWNHFMPGVPRIVITAPE
jgi:hypothetical protein